MLKTKLCTVCEVKEGAFYYTRLPISKFRKLKNGKYSSKCIECEANSNKEYAKKFNKQKGNEIKTLKYILDKDKKIIPIKTTDKTGKINMKNLLKWGKWFDNLENRIVKQEQVGKYFISTVFLGITCNFLRKGKPMLWETGIETEKDGWDIAKRYSSHKKALAGHKSIVKKYKILEIIEEKITYKGYIKCFRYSAKITNYLKDYCFKNDIDINLNEEKSEFLRKTIYIELKGKESLIKILKNTLCNYADTINKILNEEENEK